MKKTSITAIALSGVLALSLAACGGAASSSVAASTPASSAAASSAAAVILKVGATPAPHAEILEAVKPILAEQGIELQIVEFTDYVLPNTALFDGDLDANYFQHQPYLDAFNEGNGTDLVSAGSIHYEPLGLYPGKTATVAKIKDGAQIAVPNDGSNEARALYLLEAQALIKVDHEKGFTATILDITENTKNLEIVELDADKIPTALSDVDLAVINGNYAIGANINESVLTSEDAEGESATTYANIIAVRNGDDKRAEITALVEALKSEAIKTFISDKYKGSVVPSI